MMLEPGKGFCIIDAKSKQRLENTLLKGCGYCSNKFGSLRIRENVNGGKSISLQCLKCGNRVGGPFSLNAFADSQTFDVWDDDLQEAGKRLLDSHHDDKSASFRADLEDRRKEYAEFLTSDEWEDIRAKMLYYANNICQACGVNQATQVHHLTYKYGKSPPMWCLKPVCFSCHERLHSSCDEWYDPRLPSND